MLDWAFIRHHLGLDHISHRLETMMSDIATLASTVNGLADAVARIATDFAALKATLETTLASTHLSAEDQATVDAAVAQLQSSVDAVNTADPTPPPPAPTV